MNYSELKIFVEEARKQKGYSQRELSKLIGLSQSTYNDTINGKIKKVDVDILRKIAEGLDLSLKKILEVSGYIEFVDSLSVQEAGMRTLEEVELRVEMYEREEAEKKKIEQKKIETIYTVREKLSKLLKFLEIDNQKFSTSKIIEEINSTLKLLDIFDEKFEFENDSK